MTSNAKLGADSLHDLDGLSVVLYYLEEFQCCLSIFFGVKRERWIVTRYLVAVAIVGFFLLQASRVWQQYAQKFGGATGAIDWTMKALLDQARQITGVIDVGVSEQHGVY